MAERQNASNKEHQKELLEKFNKETPEGKLQREERMAEIRQLKAKIGCKIVNGPPDGTLITKVSPRGAVYCEGNGLLDNDVCLSIDDVPTPDNDAMKACIKGKEPGTVLCFKVKRVDKFEKTSTMVFNLRLGAAGVAMSEIAAVFGPVEGGK